MSKDIILGLIRHLLTFAGGTLIAKGIADQAEVSELIGGIMTVIGVIWSMASKKTVVS